MKKIMLIMALIAATLSFTQLVKADPAQDAAFHSSQTTAAGNFPTDIYVYNYLCDARDFIIVDAPQTPLPDLRLNPYPNDPYVDHIFNTNYSVNMRIILLDRFGNKFFDQRVGDHATINVRNVNGHPQASLA